MGKRTSSPEGFSPDLLLELPTGGGRGIRARLEHALRAAIQDERLPAGAVLPPSRVLAADLAVARTVVVEAYRNLAANGYLETRRGGWTRVRSHRRAAPVIIEKGEGYEAELFFGWRRPRSATQIALFGGLPDGSLFPRREWLRHYRDALSTIPDSAVGYPDILGAEPLREALAEYLSRARGAVVTPSTVVVSGGFTQALALVCRTLRRRGARRVAIEDPSHVWHRSVIEAAGLTPVPVLGDAGGLDPIALANTDADAVVVAPAHSYPRGAMLDGDRRRAVVAWAERQDRFVIEDDYDAELRYDQRPVGALQGLAPDRVIYIGTASKTLTPGLRLGWLVAPAPLVEPLAREKNSDDMGSSVFEQYTLARFFESGAFARHIRRIRPIYRDRRDEALRALEETLPAAQWEGEAAGLHLYVTLPGQTDAYAVAEAAHRRDVVVEVAGWHWATETPPALVLGYGRATPPALRRALGVIADVLARDS